MYNLKNDSLLTTFSWQFYLLSEFLPEIFCERKSPQKYSNFVSFEMFDRGFELDYYFTELLITDPSDPLLKTFDSNNHASKKPMVFALSV